MNQDWIPVGALGDAFAADNNCLPPVDDLADTNLTLHFENGWVIRHHFITDRELSWEILEGDAALMLDTESYVATRPRAGIYFVDFVKRSERATSVSLVLMIESGVFLAAIGQLPSREEASLSLLDRIDAKLELTAVRADFIRGTINSERSPDRSFPAPTRDLVGKRIEYRYSATELYEHLYLNERFYSWHCLEGSEVGLCDTDACHFFKLSEGLYFFVWREKVVPTLGVICIDLVAMKTTGKIFGYESNECSATRNFSVGAYVRNVHVAVR